MIACFLSTSDLTVFLSSRSKTDMPCLKISNVLSSFSLQNGPIQGIKKLYHKGPVSNTGINIYFSYQYVNTSSCEGNRHLIEVKSVGQAFSSAISCLCLSTLTLLRGNTCYPLVSPCRVFLCLDRQVDTFRKSVKLGSFHMKGCYHNIVLSLFFN